MSQPHTHHSPLSSPFDGGKIPGNRMWLTLVLTFITWAGATNTWAQTAPSKSGSATVEERMLRANDGWPIHIAYYPSELKKEAPVVILLHMKGGNSLIWQSKKGVARKLQDDGFAVVAVDLRKHGKSKLTSSGGAKTAKKAGGTADLKRNDYQRMVEYDLEAVKAFILEEHQKQNLNVKKLGIVAAEMSAPIAINFTVRDWLKLPYDDAPTLAARTPRGQDVHALALLSPDTSCPGVTMAKSIPFLKKRPIAMLICVGAEDISYARNAERMYQQMGGTHQTTKHIYYKKFPVKLRGTDLLGKSSIPAEKILIEFLNKYVKDLSIPWRDRQSRLR